MRNIARFSSKLGVTNWQPSFMKNHRRLCERPQGGWVTTPVIFVSNSLMSVKPSPNVMLRSERGSALIGRKSRRRGSGPLLYISGGRVPSRKRVKEVLNAPMGLNNSEV